MKNSFVFLSVILILMTGPSWFSSSGPVKKDKLLFQEKPSSIPENVNNVFENSCYGCHSEGENKLALSKLNFSEWNDYSSKKQVQKADKIYEEVSEGKMPPKKARKKHPELIPTKEQIDLILNWSKNLNAATDYNK